MVSDPIDSQYARRLGRFRINVDHVRTDHRSEMVSAVMACCVIVRAEMDFADDSIIYMAICPQFGVVPFGCEIPFYRWNLEGDPYLGQLTAHAR